MSWVDGLAENFFQEVLWTLVLRLGALVRWFYLRKTYTYQQIYRQPYNGRMGILTICVLLAVVFGLHALITGYRTTGN